MPTLTTGSIKKLKLPQAFSEQSKQIGGLGADNWTFTYRIPGEKYPEISFRYSGYPIYEGDVPAFRKLLSKPQLIFDGGANQNTELVKAASLVMGNAGDNQIANSDDPMFLLEKMEVIEIAGRNVLRVQGFFHTQEKEARVFLDCLFIDSSPPAKECKVEELYFQAFPKEIYEQYHADFEKVISEISWS